METVIVESNDAVPEAIQEQVDEKPSSIKNINNNIVIDTEELLGSVTTFPTSGIDGPAVRTSARVIHKLRMDLNPTTQPEKKETQSESSTVNPPKTPSQSKTHVKVQWINAERSFFFDALNEHGRDFEQIARVVNVKMKRKTPSDQEYKTKEHVRQQYYQFFQKASKYLRFSEDVKKHAQELYTLINYGEMRRKLVMSSDKSFLKLRELCYKGSVTIRLKGKNIKVKTPSCRALRKLNQLEGNPVEDVHLPQRIDVVLKPVNSSSWSFVQALAQNPRVRMVSLPLQKRLATLLNTMSLKWQPNNNRLYEKYVRSSVQRYGAQKVGEDIFAQSQVDVIQLKKEEPILCFKPPRETVIHRPMVQLNELLSSINLCLNSYEDRIGAKTRGEDLCSEKIAHIKDLLKHPSKRMRFDSASDKTHKLKAEEQTASSKLTEEIGIAVIDHKSNDSIDTEIKKKECENLDVKVKEDPQVKKEDANEGLIAPTVLAITTPKVEDTEKQPATNTQSVISTTKSKKLLNGNHKSNKDNTYKPLIDQEMLQKIRQGWTLSSVGDVTIGDLYLMFGSDSKLVLEYDIVEPNETQPETKSETNASKLDSKKLGTKLKNLLSIATLMEGTNSFLLANYFRRERSSNGDSGEIFKQPNGLRALNPRIKAPRWREQPVRPLGNQPIPGASETHVVRDLYSLPPTVESQAKKVQNDKDNELTKMIEEKIQGYSSNNGFSEGSRMSMPSWLDNFSHGDNRNGTSIGDGKRISSSPFHKNINFSFLIESSFSMRLLEENIKSSNDDSDNYSLSSLLCRLDNNVYDNNDQGI